MLVKINNARVLFYAALKSLEKDPVMKNLLNIDVAAVRSQIEELGLVPDEVTAYAYTVLRACKELKEETRTTHALRIRRKDKKKETPAQNSPA